MPDQILRSTLYQCFGPVDQTRCASGHGLDRGLDRGLGRGTATLIYGLAVAIVVLTVFQAFPAFAQDAEAGRHLFAKCRACHSLEAGKNGVGPSLHGVVGRKSGSLEGFKFSQPMASKNVIWNEDNLVRYLRDPKGFVPGNKMVFPGLRKDGEAEALVAYLKQAGN